MRNLRIILRALGVVVVTILSLMFWAGVIYYGATAPDADPFEEQEPRREFR